MALSFTSAQCLQQAKGACRVDSTRRWQAAGCQVADTAGAGWGGLRPVPVLTTPASPGCLEPTSPHSQEYTFSCYHTALTTNTHMSPSPVP